MSNNSETNSAKYDPKKVYHDIGWVFDRRKDEDTALKLYQLQIDVYPDSDTAKISTYNIAHIIRFRDRERSTEMFESIADTDNDALYMLGTMHRYRNPEKALEYFTKGSERGDNSCTKAVGDIHYYGYNETPRDYEEALPYYIKAAEKGHIQAIVSVGTYHRMGYANVEKSEHKEAEWLEKIPYEKIPPVTKFNLAFYYIKNRECRRDFPEKHVKGLQMMRELVDDENDKDAMYMIGECYTYGYCDVDYDKAQAKEWYIKAAELGDYDSCIKMVINTSGEDHYKYLQKAMKIRSNKYWTDRDRSEYRNTKKLSVEVKVLEDLFQKIEQQQKQIEEYELRPPIIGGKLFRDARDRWEKRHNQTV